MPDTRRLDQVLATVAAYLHNDFTVGEADQRLVCAIPQESITEDERSMLINWLWSKHAALAAALEAALYKMDASPGSTVMPLRGGSGMCSSTGS
jgi:hypothetical protein